MRTKLAIFTFFTILLSGCAVKKHQQTQSKLAVQAGINKGGITENTDMSVITALEADIMPDAFSGATKTGFNAAVKVNIPLHKNELETGLGYMYNAQSFSYADPLNGHDGTRQLNVSQFQIPLTYNVVLFRKLLPSSELQIKVGYLGQINLLDIKDEGQLPSFEQKGWSNGAILGLSAYLYEFSNGNRIGFYTDVYRGSQIYFDFYNQKKFEMPGTSFIKAGLRYQFK